MDIEIAIAAVSAFGSVVSALAAAIAAVGIWHFGRAMNRTNETRAAQAEQQAKDAAEDRAQAAEDRKVTQAMLAALTELLRRTSPPQSQTGPAE